MRVWSATPAAICGAGLSLPAERILVPQVRLQLILRPTSFSTVKLSAGVKGGERLRFHLITSCARASGQGLLQQWVREEDDPPARQHGSGAEVVQVRADRQRTWPQGQGQARYRRRSRGSAVRHSGCRGACGPALGRRRDRPVADGHPLSEMDGLSERWPSGVPASRRGGGCEIRTREGLPPTRFPSVRPRPLGESSAGKLIDLPAVRTPPTSR